MEAILTNDIQSGLDAARLAGLRRKGRLHLDVNGQIYRVLRLWKSGFSIEAADAPHLRGLVDLYDGPSHLFQCLIIASEEEAGEMRFEFKRATLVATQAPLDFEAPADAPIALIGDGRFVGWS